MNDKHIIELIAPCGMYCGICDKYLAYSHQIPRKRGKISHCKGCKPTNKNCSFFKKKCENGKIYKITYCFQCELFPCQIQVKGSQKYKNRYGYSFLESLNAISTNGADWFINETKGKYRCEKCGDTICVHNQKCYTCDVNHFLNS